MFDYRSWGNQPSGWHRVYRHLKPGAWALQRLIADEPETLLPYGNGRSYGDVCLNPGHALVDARALNRILHFDPRDGILHCEAGVTFARILELATAHGWFAPVVPSTKYLTVGGAIANDVHGRDHVKQGTIGSHVLSFTLVRSDGVHFCSPGENSELFRATIGGMGLTGFIYRAVIQLKRVSSPYLSGKTRPFRGLKECLDRLAEAAAQHEYVTAWLDLANRGSHFARGFVLSGSHAATPAKPRGPRRQPGWLSALKHAPPWLLNPTSVRAFNYFYARRRRTQQIFGYETFLFQLDRVPRWNSLYGREGLLQYQFVLPQNQSTALGPLLETIRRRGPAPYFAILKPLGDRPSPGLISFPMAGITGALDFSASLKPQGLFRELNQIVLAAGGRLYAAKDRCMTPELFDAGYPNLDRFSKSIDPKFSSAFWRRVRPNHEIQPRKSNAIRRDVGDRHGDRTKASPNRRDLSPGSA